MLRRFFRALGNFFRANFFAGVFIAAPIAVTVVVLKWLWEQIDGPLQTIFRFATGPQETPWARLMDAIRDNHYLDPKFLVPCLGLLILLLSVLMLGIVTRSIIGRMALSGLEVAVSRIPIVGMLYMSVKQFGEAFFTTDGHTKFQRAVIVQFPYKGCWAVGFVTGKVAHVLPVPAPPNGGELLTIFVPTTPLPTAGFMIVVPENETHALEITVQDALKLVISGGVISPGESQKHKLQPQNELERRLRETQKIKITPVESEAHSP